MKISQRGVAQNAANPETRKRAIKFFKDEYVALALGGPLFLSSDV